MRCISFCRFHSNMVYMHICIRRLCLLMYVLYFYAVLPTHITISVTRVGETIVGRQFSLICEINQVAGLTSQQLSIQWLDSQGNPVVNGSGVSVQGPERSGTQTTFTLQFDSLSLEHSQEYICLATLTSPAPPFEFEREAIQDVIVGK